MSEVRLIDANELKALRELYIQGKLQFIGNEYDLIDKCPTIDAEPVRHGWWIERKAEFKDGVIKVDRLECSECGKTQRSYLDTPYCPGCGAKMDRSAVDE